MNELRRTLRVIEEGIGQGLHRGAQLVVQHRGQSASHALGEARPGVAMTEATRMLWMSAGKPITAIAILQQIERGRTTLDTRVAEVLPVFAQHGKEAITIRHLLTHTAGFRGPLNSFAPGPWEAIIDRCCALKLEPNWKPGEKAGYHVASSWFILGELLRLLDGRPIERYVKEEVFDRVGAVSASLGIDSVESPIEPDFVGNTPDAIQVPRPPANCFGTMHDLSAVYTSLLTHDGRLLRPETSRQMIERQREGMFDETFKQTIDWGLGFKLDSKRYRDRNNGIEQYGYGPHASDATFGHSGNQCSCAFADPEHDLVVAWCTNGMPGEAKHQQRQHAINAAVYEDLVLA